MDYPWNTRHSILTRRQALQSTGAGLGLIGLANLIGRDKAIGGDALGLRPDFAPKAKRIIHLFMNGGPFQCDLFDPKPALSKYAGQKPEGADLRTERPTGALMAVPFEYCHHGQSGLAISELLPYTSQLADDLCVIRSMYTDNPNHGPALFMMNNGTITPNRPTLGAWLSYRILSPCALGVRCGLQSFGPMVFCQPSIRGCMSITRIWIPKR
jgi:hypothetical protein